ncbi:hypothetical protein Cni_G09261 [Canna indica]|uniref:Uncharacterized protein n=1 Tax=Canna indica TaxID=4628 RepID=A0AAQ3K487_9LILI|nr:hypothetical protein Cni_G09261 [Canna indica]
MYGSPPVPPSEDLNLPYHYHHQQQMSSSLLWYLSAPITLLREVYEDFTLVRGFSAKTDTVFARFLASNLREEPFGGAATTGQSSPRFSPSSLPHMQNPSSKMKSVDLGSSSDLVRHDSSPRFPHHRLRHTYQTLAQKEGQVGSKMEAASRWM